jgi:predicted TIM-barrel enzyme
MPDVLSRLGDPAIVAVLHLPDFAFAWDGSMARLEDYVLTNAAVFAEAGIPALMIQDQTRETGAADPRTIAIMSALGSLVRRTHPDIPLGIIVQAHDAIGPLAIARACGAAFVRLKVFVAASMTQEGVKSALGVEAREARQAMGADEVAILADVFDRTSLPLVDVPPVQGAKWAENLGADGLILTGSSFEDSLDRVRSARQGGVRRPILIGGGVSEENVAEAIAVADGCIISTSLMQDGPGPRWSRDKTLRFMETVRRSRA